MIKYASILVVALMATAAFAVPALNWTSVDVGGGMFGYTFFIDNNDGLAVSNGITVGFSAAQQVGAFYGAVIVNKQGDADLYGGMPTSGYNKALDSWVFNPFALNTLPGSNPLTGTPIVGGFLEEAGGYAISVGSGPGSQITNGANVAYIVAGETGGVYQGVIARNGVSYAISGVYPEPATMSLLGLGALALIRRK